MNWVNGPLLQHIGGRAGFRRPHLAVRGAAVVERQDADARECANDADGDAGVLLPTTVIGSYSVPEWLGQLKNDYYRHRISRRYLDEIHEMAIKAAVVDQEQAGIDIVSDGELRRDNDVDYLLARIPGVEIARPDKADYFDYYDASISQPAARAGPGEPRAGRGLPVRQAAHRPAGEAVDHRAVLAGPPDPRHLGERLRRPRRPGAGAGPRARRRGGGTRPGPAPGCCRSTSRSWPGIPRTSSWRSRRSTS